MRIISGTYKGCRILPPKNITARPTTDFAKEALFNLLQNRIDFEGVSMLDLFAGTGGIGIEFISRGAADVTAVELAHVQQNFIISCCKTLGIRNLQLIRGDVFRFIAACHVQYDFIYADPPYALDKLASLPDLIFGLDTSTHEPLSTSHSILLPDGLFVLEHGRDNDFSSHPRFVEHRNYGNVHFSFFQ
ncbi:MAG: RsmD family RNA methyltransferase [Paludibacteraceae bacterium]|nr:RsmD family RNA methyltransferase [Paludibacteraceae bacterium]